MAPLADEYQLRAALRPFSLERGLKAQRYGHTVTVERIDDAWRLVRCNRCGVIHTPVGDRATAEALATIHQVAWR
jgi:hypothetical protein